MKERLEPGLEFQVRDKLDRFRRFRMHGKKAIVHEAFGNVRHRNGLIHWNGGRMLLGDRSHFDVGIATHNGTLRSTSNERPYR